MATDDLLMASSRGQCSNVIIYGTQAQAPTNAWTPAKCLLLSFTLMAPALAQGPTKTGYRLLMHLLASTGPSRFLSSPLQSSVFQPRKTPPLTLVMTLITLGCESSGYTSACHNAQPELLKAGTMYHSPLASRGRGNLVQGSCLGSVQ